jgi:hypothetical protein
MDCFPLFNQRGGQGEFEQVLSMIGTIGIIFKISFPLTPFPQGREDFLYAL